MHWALNTLIFFLFISCAQYVNGQDVDQTSQYLEDAKSFFSKKEYDSTYFLSKKAYTNFIDNNQDSLALASALLLFESHPKLVEKDSTDFYSKLKRSHKNSTKWKDQLNINLAIGNGFFTAQEYDKALPYYIKIDSIAKLQKYISPLTIKAIIKRSEISRLTFTRESVEEAYNLAQKALEDSKNINHKPSEYLTYVYLSDLSGHVGKVEQCKEYIDLALPYFKQNGNVKFVARLYTILNSYYLEKKEYQKAVENFETKLNYLSDKKEPLLLAQTYYYYGYFNRYRIKDYKNALTLLQKSYALYEPLNEKETILYQRLLRDLGSCHLELGNYESASRFYEDAYDLKIELDKKANRRRSKEVESKYQAIQNEKEIALLSAQNELIQEQKNSQQRLFIAIITLSLLAGTFAFILYRNRQKTANKLKELDTAKSHFFSNISHELRTPLTLISGPIQNKLADQTTNDKDKKEYQLILKNTNRLTQLVDQILDISKIESGNMKLNIGKTNPLPIIRSIIHDFEFIRKEKQIQLKTDIKNDEFIGWVDTDALQKIVTNLLSNSFKFTPEKGIIEVASHVKGKNLHLEIKNSGKGLLKEQTSLIFKRFYQTHSTQGGTGIGLALVNELVRLHGGTISVDSEINKWTRFKLSISLDKKHIDNHIVVDAAQIVVQPTSNSFSDEESNIVEAPINSELPILLIIEDNVDLGNLLQDNFRNDFQIIRAFDGDEGQKIALEKVPDLIISDVMMPVKDGIALTNELKSDLRTSHIPIILLTARAGDANELIGLKTGADDYITKPFNQKILATKVLNLLENRRKLQKRYSQEVVLKPKDIAVNSVDEQFLTKVQFVLDNNLIESGFTAEAFAKAIEMSRMQLHRKLKALTGLSTTEFIRSQRLKIASQLLKKADTNISQIGYAVGFSDPAYFTKCFKETYGLTPTDFLKKAE